MIGTMVLDLVVGILRIGGMNTGRDDDRFLSGSFWDLVEIGRLPFHFRRKSSDGCVIAARLPGHGETSNIAHARCVPVGVLVCRRERSFRGSDHTEEYFGFSISIERRRFLRTSLLEFTGFISLVNEDLGKGPGVVHGLTEQLFDVHIEFPGDLKGFVHSAFPHQVRHIDHDNGDNTVH